MKRIVLCEGPDDLAALREISTFVFKTKPRRTAASASPGGQPRRMSLDCQSGSVVDIVSGAAKNGLPKLLADQLASMVPYSDGEPEWSTDIGIVFDPDNEAPESGFIPSLAAAISESASGWTVSERLANQDWIATRSTEERVRLHPIPWRGTGAPLDSLGNEQSLERLLCSMAAKAYPDQVALVARWLDEFPSGSKKSWKGAVHLWCALVESDQNEATAPARFLHQNRLCKPHVVEMLESLGLTKELAPLFA